MTMIGPTEGQDDQQPTPQTQPTQPSQPATPAQPTQPAQPQAPAQNPNQTATQQPVDSTPVSQTGPSMHARIFDKILKGMSGGDIKVVNPDGTISTQPQSRASMGKSIVAAALTGLMTPTHYRETPYGPVIDYSAGAADAAARGKAAFAAPREAAQKLSDEQQTRKLMTIQNNARMVQIMAASAHMKHQILTDLTDNAKDFLKPFEDYDAQRTDDASTPKAFLNKDQSADEVLSGGHKLTDSNVIPDGGIRRKYNPTTQTWDEEPTYAVLNPDLKDVQLPESVTKKLAEINSQYKDIHAVTGGTLRLPINAYVSAMHDYQTVTQGEHILNTLNKEINGDDAKEINLSPIVRGDRQNMLRALGQMEASPAGGNSPSQRPDNVLDTILKTPNGDKLLELLGMTPEEADKFIQGKNNERLKASTEAKQGDLSPKAVAAPETVSQVTDAIKADPTLTTNQKDTLLSGSKKLTNQGVVDLKKQHEAMQRANQSNQTRLALAGGDDKAINAFANNVVEGDLNQIKELPPRGDARIKAINRLHAEAVGRGLDSTKYTDEAIKVKGLMLDDYASNKKGSTGAQLTSFDGYLQHTAGLLDAEKRLEGKTLGLTRSPWLNTKMSELAKQVTNDPDYKAFETSIQPVRNEIENFLAAGYKPSDSEQASINAILSPDETPARITAAVKQLAMTADDRLAAMGKTYTNTMDTNRQGLLSPDSIRTLQKMGIQSKALAYSTPFPRGWQGGKPTLLTDRATAEKFVKAAGYDRQRAVDLARANGFILQ